MPQRLDFVSRAHEVVAGPEDIGSEQRWRVRLEDGTCAVVGRLSPELARDESIRRRYVRDMSRVRELELRSVAPTLEVGPADDPYSPTADPPWRMRVDPDGERLSDWLERAPVPVDEAARVCSALADAVHAVHEAGAVLRDLSPRNIVRTPDGRIVLTDVGLSRVDVLSSHTASSLLLEGSPYVSPEALFRTAIDQRSDLFSLGMIVWEALTGTHPFGDGHALLREHAPLPSLTQLRPEVPESVDAVVRACLEREPSDRPESATEIAWVLRGGPTQLAQTRERATCQHCAAPLRAGQRLCLACGHVATKFEHLPAQHRKRYGLELVSAKEDAGYLQRLRKFLGSLASRPVRDLEFLIGDPMMYSEQERSRRIRLPARLFNDLPRETAVELQAQMKEMGMEARLIQPQTFARKMWTALGVAAMSAIVVNVAASFEMTALAIVTGVGGFVGTVVLLSRAMTAMNERDQPALYRLRAAAAALPASDPLVARLSQLLRGGVPEDVKLQVGEMALLVQRLVDHRAALEPHQAADVAFLTEPLVPLVDLIEAQVLELEQITTQLGQLDEGTIVRALAASSARGEGPVEREPLLAGLDRLRALEDARAAAFHRLLEASDLLRRSVTLGLEVQDPVTEHTRQIQLALAALE